MKSQTFSKTVVVTYCRIGPIVFCARFEVSELFGDRIVGFISDHFFPNELRRSESGADGAI